MRKTLFLFAVAVLGLTGCGSQPEMRDKRGKPPGGLDAAEYEKLIDFNVLQNDNSAARKAVYGDKLIGLEANEKVSKLAKMISDNCSGDRELPDEEMSGSSNDQTIEGGLCPIYWARTRTYNSGTRSFTFIDDFTANSVAYIAESPITRRWIVGNFSSVISGVTKTISGTIHIQQFQVKDKGPVKGSIVLQSEYTGSRGEGSLTLNLTLYGRSSHTGTITWAVPKFEPKYFVDGREIELKEFEDLFSAFELTKIMANSMKMR